MINREEQLSLGFTLEDDRLLHRFNLIRDKNNHLQRQLAQAKALNRTCNKDNELLRQEVQNSKLSMIELQQQVQGILNKFSEIQERLREYQVQNKCLKERNQSLQFQLSKEISSNKQSFQNKLTVLREQLKQLQLVREYDKETITSLEKDLGCAKSENVQLRARVECGVNSGLLERRADKAYQENQRLRKMLNQSEDRNQQHENQIQDLHKKVLSRENKIAEYKELIRSMKQSIIRNEHSVLTLTQAFERAEKMLSQVSNESSKYRTSFFQIKQMSNQLLSKIRKEACLPTDIVNEAKVFTFGLQKLLKRHQERQRSTTPPRSRSKSRTSLSAKRTPTRQSQICISQKADRSQITFDLQKQNPMGSVTRIQWPFSPMNKGRREQSLSELRVREQNLFSKRMQGEESKDTREQLRRVSRLIEEKENKRE